MSIFSQFVIYKLLQANCFFFHILIFYTIHTLAGFFVFLCIIKNILLFNFDSIESCKFLRDRIVKKQKVEQIIIYI